jgi:hypothetical protein
VLAEAGAGGLLATEPTGAIGGFANARLGARLLAVGTERSRDIPIGVDLVLDAGVGEGVYWLSHAGWVDRPHAFVGWGSVLSGRRHAVHLELRVAVSPHLDDPTALRAICRGTCTGTSDAPADITMQFVFGVVSW